jgi:NAD+ synthase (glutamine-hydrolysing)
MCQLVVEQITKENALAAAAGGGKVKVATGGVDRNHVCYKTHRDVQRFATAAEREATNGAKAGALLWGYEPTDWKELCGRILFTCYMASTHSGDETRGRAEALAKETGCTHSSIFIDSITDALKGSFAQLKVHSSGTAIEAKTQTEPRFGKNGGTWMEDIALQNIQARARMTMSYLCGQV